MAKRTLQEAEALTQAERGPRPSNPVHLALVTFFALGIAIPFGLLILDVCGRALGYPVLSREASLTGIFGPISIGAAALVYGWRRRSVALWNHRSLELRYSSDSTAGTLTAHTIGCSNCWPNSADEAWRSRGALEPDAQLVEESHFRVSILRCRNCGQTFLLIFAESIDWEAGNDPQAWAIVPLTAHEVHEMVCRNSPPTESDLSELVGDRRSLMHLAPKQGEPLTHWGIGLHLPPHD